MIPFYLLIAGLLLAFPRVLEFVVAAYVIRLLYVFVWR